MIEFDLGAYLATRPNVTAVVGTSGIFGDKAPQKKEPPFIVYSMAGGETFYHSLGASGLAEASITITCKAKSYVKARQLYEILRDELDGYRGDWGSSVIRGAFLTEPNNVSESDGGGGNDTGHLAVRGGLTVHYFRAVPTFGES